ncbi:MAG TPA: ABC transporter permease [Acidimicrobiales bacterium]
MTVFLALRDLRRGIRRFVLLGIVVALVALLSTVLSGLASGLVTDGISGLRALPLEHLAFQDGADATFSRSTLRGDAVEAFTAVDGVEATPIGATFVNATSPDGGPSIDIALFGVASDTFLVADDDAAAALDDGEPGLVLDAEMAEDGVEVGDRYVMGGSGVELPVVAFTDIGSYGHAPIAFVPLETWQQVQYGADVDDRFSAVALRGASKADLQRAAGDDIEVLTRTEAYAGSPGYTAETTTMTLIRGFLLVISALVVGAFFTVLTVQRTRQIGLLKAMGAGNGYVARDAVGQMTILVALATGVGVAVGIGIVGALAGTDAPVELDPPSVATVAVLLVASGVIGSLVAIRRITQVEPAIALGVEP